LPFRSPVLSSTCEFAVRVTTRSNRNQLTMDSSGAIKVYVSAAPADNAANEAVVATVAGALDLAKSRVEIIRGHKNRNKTLRVTGLSNSELKAKLAVLTKEGADG